MKIFLILLASVLSILYPCTSYSQKPQFGVVSLTELKMTQYEMDSSASAVILYDYGHFNQSSFTFTRHLRIKILKKSGLYLANQTFRLNSKGSIKGYTHGMDGDLATKVKLKNEDIHEEFITDYLYVYNVLMPNVTVGSIIELEYTIPVLPYTWQFQSIIPTLHSELKIDQINSITFSVTSLGFLEIEVLGNNHWKVMNAPAFHQEPQMPHYINYLSRIEIQVESRSYFSFSSSWEEIGTYLYSTQYIHVLEACDFLNKKAKELKEMNISEKEKIDSAVYYIKSNIKWNGQESPFLSFETYFEKAPLHLEHKFKKDHSGNSAEINLLIATLLNRMEIQTYPVVLSTIDNGIINPYIPSINKLNYVISYVHTEENDLLIDATSPLINILPNRCLNGQGWLVSKSYGQWIDLTGKNKNIRKHVIQVSVNPEIEEISAIISTNYIQHAHSNFVLKMEDVSSVDFHIKDLEDKFNLEINDYNWKIVNPSRHISNEQFSTRTTDGVLVVGDEIYLDPLVMFDYKSNPFSSEERIFPINFITSKVHDYTYIIKIPDGYEVINNLEPSMFDLLNQSATFNYLVNKSEKEMQLKIVLNINKEVFIPDEYDALRNFFSEIISKTSQKIVLRKI